MSELERWREGNERHLAAALAWLRLLLTRFAQHALPPNAPGARIAPTTTDVATPASGTSAPPPGIAASPASAAAPLGTPAPPVSPPSAARSLHERLLRRRAAKRAAEQPASQAPAAARPVLALPPATGGVSAEEVEAAARAMAAAEALTPPPALLELAERFGLSRFEREVLLLCAALELDTGFAALCARAQDDPSRPHPTYALALALFSDAAWDALSPEGPLRHWRLIEINQPAGRPLTTAALSADERIVSYFKGLHYLDDRLTPLLLPPPPAAALPPSQQAVAEDIVRRLHQTAAGERLPLVQLLGPDPPSQQQVAARAAAELGLPLYRLPAEALPSQVSEVEALARLVQREMTLFPFALYVDTHEVEGTAPGQASPLGRFLARAQGVFFLGSREVRREAGLAGFEADVAKPTPGEQQAAWNAALGASAGDAPGRLAAQFRLNLSDIGRIAAAALAEPAAGAEDLADRLWDACLATTRPRLDSLAERLRARATWDDLVLPAAETELLHQIAGQVGQRSKVYEEWGFAARGTRGLGINALFAGESGTGKTMAAEVLANDLRLDLYRIDLSAVVSKYIGETEKNLRRLFDAAEDGGALLFFDEADALFGKRSEVKDSHDRYANIEINYLLQRMESYGGLAILATNMKSALDTAFLRRLRFVVTFPYPGLPERKAIWQRAFPAGTPRGELDLDRLARFNLTGGHIRNIAVNAAFLAARAGTPVTMGLVLQATLGELRKLERPINEGDFRAAAAPVAGTATTASGVAGPAVAPPVAATAAAAVAATAAVAGPAAPPPGVPAGGRA